MPVAPHDYYSGVPTCPRCGSENRPGASFCSHCGLGLERVCPNGHAVAPEARFCDICGAPADAVNNSTSAAASPAAVVAREPEAERRLVTVLFADLVGFTAASEGRDAEETRELLTRYFDLARTLIARFGGTVEKFIGDAVMAVWGAPVANEDDAERAVRAALDLVASVPELDANLQARAGVLTGEAAVTLHASGQGMVAGDLVNTASRLQSVADPGSVVVGEATRRSTENAIAYESVGSHELKGKQEPVALWRALRLLSGRAGSLRSAGLEPPFVGRDRELKLIKDLFHACGAERKTQLVSVTGIAGIGKSRLLWEFYKYIDGLVDDTWWHRGRCLAYGDGVTYWALADMVRMRCRIAEDEDASAALQKLHDILQQHVPDTEERRFIAPRLAQLIGLEEGVASDRQDLFAAWRLFFERLAHTAPVILAFEDLQWADAALLDFIEYLLQWSRDLPLYVITLGRPELHERRPGWGAGQRNFSSLYLEPLSRPAMTQLLEGLVPGLAADIAMKILDRAQGVPLYAVETIRMLIDRGLIVPDDGAYRVQGSIENLDVPETLQALISARLDGLDADERRLLQHASVLGKTFTLQALAALAGDEETELEPRLASLVRKEMLSIQSDPRSPERGQYSFLQDLVRHVTYETLARRDRKSRHLAAAAHLEATMAEEEISEVLAAHYIAAYEAAPDADDAQAIRQRVREMLVRAGDRAAQLGAPDEGSRYYAQAAELSAESAVRAELLVRAGRLNFQANHLPEARRLLEQATALYAAIGDTRGRGRAVAALADVENAEGRTDYAARQLEEALAALDDENPNADLAVLLAQLGRMHVLSRRPAEAKPLLERALSIAERLLLPEVLFEALISKASMLEEEGRPAECRIILEAVFHQAGEAQLYRTQLRAGNNLMAVLENFDHQAEVVAMHERVVALAALRGESSWEVHLRTGVVIDLYYLGRWEEALRVAAEERARATWDFPRIALLDVALIHCELGDVARARALLEEEQGLRDSGSHMSRASYLAVEARVLRAEGHFLEALAAVTTVIELLPTVMLVDERARRAHVEAIEAAFEMGDRKRVRALLNEIEQLAPAQLTPFLDANRHRLTARLKDSEAQPDVDEHFRHAAALFREGGYRFFLAVTCLEWAESLMAHDRIEEARPLLEEAKTIFAELRAAPWLQRTRAASSREAVLA